MPLLLIDINCGFFGSLLVYFALYYAHTNWFCVAQENIKTSVLKVQTELFAHFVLTFEF